MYLPYRAGEDKCQHIELYVSLCFIIDHQLKETITTAMPHAEHQTWKLLITMQPCMCPHCLL